MTSPDKMTRRELVIIWLEGAGFHLTEYNSRKYTAFKKEGDPLYYFVGKRGGLWWGRTVSEMTGLGPFAPDSLMREYAGYRQSGGDLSPKAYFNRKREIQAEQR